MKWDRLKLIISDCVMWSANCSLEWSPCAGCAQVKSTWNSVPERVIAPCNVFVPELCASAIGGR